MKLLELKKYAIDHRVDIKFSDPDKARECEISSRGLVRIPGEDKDFRVEDALSAARDFIIVSQGADRHLTREAMTKEISAASGKTNPGASVEEEE
jgi:hypothetical protein